MDSSDEWTAWMALYHKSGEGKLANYDQITDQLYLGGQAGAESQELLQNILKVDVVVTVAQSMETLFPELFEYKVIQIEDLESADIKQHLKELILFLEH